MKSQFGWACVMVAGCAFGGGSDDPTDGVVTLALDAGEPSSADEGDDDVPVVVRDASTLDATVRSDAGSADAGKADAGNKCGPDKALAMCDPVKNTGCTLVWQCDLNTAGTAQAGRCVLFNPLSLGGCGADDLSTTCAGGSACISNACQQLCYCDSDCDMGKKCKGTAPGAAGPVKFCQ
jgi:hypothetical protein